MNYLQSNEKYFELVSANRNKPICKSLQTETITNFVTEESDSDEIVFKLIDKNSDDEMLKPQENAILEEIDEEVPLTKKAKKANTESKIIMEESELKTALEKMEQAQEEKIDENSKDKLVLEDDKKENSIPESEKKEDKLDQEDKFVPEDDKKENSMESEITIEESELKTAPVGISIGFSGNVNFDFVMKKQNNSCEPPWTEKYKPKNLSEFLGNEKKISEVKQWLMNHFNKKDDTKLGLMIVGPPGCGKTVAASLVPRSMGYSVQEFNMMTVVTGKRDKKMSKGNPNNESSFILDGIIPAMTRNNIANKPHVVVLDQAEDIAEAREYKVLWKLPESEEKRLQKPLHGILQPVRMNAIKSKRKEKEIDGKTIVEDVITYHWPAPLIMTVNDYQARSINELKNATVRGAAKSKKKEDKEQNNLIKIIFFERIPYNFIEKRLEQICKEEKIDSKGLNTIARCSCGDMRKAITMLEAACSSLPTQKNGKKILTPEHAKKTAMLYSMTQKSALLQGKSFTPEDEELSDYIPDMTAQDVVSTVLRDEHNRDYLDQLFKKFNEPFIESMLRTHIPMYIVASYGSVRHKLLPPVSKKWNKPDLNVLEGMAQICESWSTSDLFFREGAWKKNELYDYYIFHSRVLPCELAKHQDRNNKFPIKLEWKEAIKENGMYNSIANSRKKMNKLKMIFQTDEFGIMTLAKLFTHITFKWNIIEFVEGVGNWLFPQLYLVQERSETIPDITDLLQTATNASVWEISKAIYRYLTLPIKSEAGDLEETGIHEEADDEVLTVELIDYFEHKKAKKEEYIEKQKSKKAKKTKQKNEKEKDVTVKNEKDNGGKKKNSKKNDEKKDDKADEDMILDLDQDLYERMKIAQDKFAKFLVICRITNDDLKDLAHFAWYEKDGHMIQIKEFCPGIRQNASLGSRMDQIWDRLDRAGIHASKRLGTFDRIINNEALYEKKVAQGIEGIKKIDSERKEPSLRMSKGNIVPTALIANTMYSLMQPYIKK